MGNLQNESLDKPDCIYIGSTDMMPYHEIGVLSKILDQQVYFASSLEEIELSYKTDELDLNSIKHNETSFICISSQGIKQFEGSVRLQAADLKRFIVSSQKSFPEPFTGDLLKELANESISFIYT